VSSDGNGSSGGAEGGPGGLNNGGVDQRGDGIFMSNN
jgi:hypothetical protein